MCRSRGKKATQRGSAWTGDVIRKAFICEGPCERPAARVALNQFSKTVVGDLWGVSARQRGPIGLGMPGYTE